MLLVGAGVSTEGLSNKIEIVDMMNENVSWKNFQNLPVKLDKAVSGMQSENIPIICGKFYINVHFYNFYLIKYNIL